jgi:uncharacterized membrane protein
VAVSSPPDRSMTASTISSATWISCSRNSEAAAWVRARTPNAPAAHSPRPGIPRRAEPPVTWTIVGTSAEKTERAAYRQRRPVVEARWCRVCERASTERARAAAAVRRRGVDREVDAAVTRTEVLQGSKDGRLIGYVYIERLSARVAYLRERLGGARGACDRPAVAQ